MTYSVKYTKKYVYEAGSFHDTLVNYFEDIMDEDNLENKVQMCQSVDFILDKM